MRTINLNLLKHQADFINDQTTRNLALVGGRGAGKTYALALKVATLAATHAGFKGVACSPTGPMASKVLVPYLRDTFDEIGFDYRYNKSSRTFEINFGSKVSTIFVLSAENTRDGLGTNLAWCAFDEADTMKLDVALEAWRKISGAVRVGNPKFQQKVAVSTPEGFGFMHHFWVQSPDENGESKRIIHAKSTDNPYLPQEYLNDLRASYPAEYLTAYLEGQFVNMAGRVVYDHYEMFSGSNTDLTVNDIHDYEELLVGIDFNIAGMSGVIAVERNNELHVIAEELGAHDTQALADILNDKYRNLTAYPDPAGNQRRTSSSNTDHIILKNNGIRLKVMNSHPRVRDRVNSVNAMFLNGQKQRRLLVNKKTCPGLHKALITQTWNSNGDPDKGTIIGLPSTKNTLIDGPLDALGYVIYARWPVKNLSSPNIRISGF